MGRRGQHAAACHLALAMKFAAGFITGGVVLYVVPTAIAVWLSERNLRRS